MVRCLAISLSQSGAYAEREIVILYTGFPCGTSGLLLCYDLRSGYYEKVTKRNVNNNTEYGCRIVFV